MKIMNYLHNGLCNLIIIIYSLGICQVEGDSRSLDGVAEFHIPFVVSIQARENGYTHLCGGTIIHKQIILTAAHCFIQHNSARDLSVVVGSNKLLLNETADRHQVNSIYSHEYYEPFLGYDIALVRLEEPLLIDGKRLALLNYKITNNAFMYGFGSGYLIGWGRTRKDLELVSFISYNKEKCRNRGFIYLSSTDLCGFSYLGRGACDGDSGGPLVNEEFNVLIGLVSYGRELCEPHRLYVFTAIYPLVDWITEQMEDLLMSD